MKNIEAQRQETTPRDSSSGENDNDLKQLTVPGLYSSSGFDLLSTLSRVYMRPNPQIQLGPVDLSCSFVVSDPTKPDCPIVYVSDAFTELTGYGLEECIGKNCRFLQSVSTEPDGLVKQGELRRYTDNNVVYKIRKCVDNLHEGQFTLINYKKGGEPFINLVSMIPVDLENGIKYIVGFQVNLIDQPMSIMNKMRNGTYIINYSLGKKTTCQMKEIEQDDTPSLQSPSGLEFLTEMTGKPQLDMAKQDFYKNILNNTNIFCISMRGVFLYSSHSCCKLFEYQEKDLVGKNMSDFCHQGDWVSVSRDLKAIPNQQPTDLQFVVRFKRNQSGYFWVALKGKMMVLEKPKGKRFIIFTALEQSMPSLDINDTAIFGGQRDALWTKMSTKGLFLVVTPRDLTENYFDMENKHMFGKSILDYAHVDDYLDLQEALAISSNGKIVRLFHRMRHRDGRYVTVETVLFPGGKLYFNDLDNNHITSVFGRIKKLHDTEVMSLLTPNINPAFLDDIARLGGMLSAGRPRVQVFNCSHSNLNYFHMFDPSKTQTWQYDLHVQTTMNKDMVQRIQ